jgi:2,4-dienoyl-CoA reductase-like NADH-dependent reductase (Old Yellow Enzyme family)
VSLVAILKGLGVDIVDCSSGGIVPDTKIPLGPGCQVPFAERIRREAGLLTIAMGMITEPQLRTLSYGKVKPMRSWLARQFLREPYWPIYAARALGYDIRWPVQYERAKPK